MQPSGIVKNTLTKPPWAGPNPGREPKIYLRRKIQPLTRDLPLFALGILYLLLLFIPPLLQPRRGRGAGPVPSRRPDVAKAGGFAPSRLRRYRFASGNELPPAHSPTPALAFLPPPPLTWSVVGAGSESGFSSCPCPGIGIAPVASSPSPGRWIANACALLGEKQRSVSLPPPDPSPPWLPTFRRKPRLCRDSSQAETPQRPPPPYPSRGWARGSPPAPTGEGRGAGKAPHPAAGRPDGHPGS